MKIEKNDLFDYPNRYIYQDKNAFKFSVDSILLAEYVKVKKDSLILDMCTGNAPVPLILSTKTKNKIIVFEIQKEIYNLAKKSVSVNNLDEQIEIINDDIRNITKIFPGKYFDVITCNPPYFVYNHEKEKNKNDIKTIARHEVTITLKDIFKIVSTILKDNGVFYLVHRLERIDDIVLLCEENNLKIKELQIICTKDDEAKIVLLKIAKHAKRGIKIGKIINISKFSSYKNIFDGR